MDVPCNSTTRMEVPPKEICGLGDPFGRICAKLLDPEFLKTIASRDPLNVTYRNALQMVFRLGALAGYDCIHDKPLELKPKPTTEDNEPK